jgi:hypothetical protein
LYLSLVIPPTAIEHQSLEKSRTALRIVLRVYDWNCMDKNTAFLQKNTTTLGIVAFPKHTGIIASFIDLALIPFKRIF